MVAATGAAADRCTATTRSGEACRNRAQYGDGKCGFHSATSAAVEARREASRRGGRGKADSARVTALRDRPDFGIVLEPAEVMALVSVALRATLSGRVAPATASAVASLARAFTALHQVVAVDARITEIERTLADVEARR